MLIQKCLPIPTWRNTPRGGRKIEQIILISSINPHNYHIDGKITNRSLCEILNIKNKTPIISLIRVLLKLVPKARLELARAIAHHPLKMACLPVPPLRQTGCTLYSIVSLTVNHKYYFCAGVGADSGVAGTSTELGIIV